MEKDKEKLVLDNMELAYSIAWKYKDRVKNMFELEDAQQVCLMGLIKAADTYDETKGVAFSTYAYTVIRNHLITPSLVRAKKQRGAVVVALDEPLTSEDTDFSLLTTLADEFDIEAYHIANEEVNCLHKYIDELPELQKQIMRLRCNEKTFEEIARLLDVGIPYIQQQYQKGLNALRYKFRVRKG